MESKSVKTKEYGDNFFASRFEQRMNERKNKSRNKYVGYLLTITLFNNGGGNKLMGEVKNPISEE